MKKLNKSQLKDITKIQINHSFIRFTIENSDKMQHTNACAYLFQSSTKMNFEHDN